jgi:hypothetical protein
MDVKPVDTFLFPKDYDKIFNNALELPDFSVKPYLEFEFKKYSHCNPQFLVYILHQMRKYERKLNDIKEEAEKIEKSEPDQMHAVIERYEQVKAGYTFIRGIALWIDEKSASDEASTANSENNKPRKYKLNSEYLSLDGSQKVLVVHYLRETNKLASKESLGLGSGTQGIFFSVLFGMNADNAEDRLEAVGLNRQHKKNPLTKRNCEAVKGFFETLGLQQLADRVDQDILELK